MIPVRNLAPAFPQAAKRMTCGLGAVLLVSILSISEAAAEPQPDLLANEGLSHFFGAELSVAELAAQGGAGAWFPISAAAIRLAEGLAASPDDASTASAAVARLAMADSAMVDAAALRLPTAPVPPLQTAALNAPLQLAAVGDELLQRQIAAVDSAMRYLCPDKIYADLYPSGAGWNEHAYAQCGSRGALDPDHIERRFASLDVPSLPPSSGPGDGPIIIPCGSSITNISSIAISGPMLAQRGNARGIFGGSTVMGAALRFVASRGR